MTENKYDCAVVGGGVSGVCAAVSAARSGLHTLLVEQRSSLGGTVSAGFQRHICGLYANDPAHPFTILNNGIASEIVKRLDRKKPGDNKTRMGRMEVHSFETQHLVDVLTSVAAAEGDLDIVLSTTVDSVSSDENIITTIGISRNGKADKIISGAVIDCSGGDVIARTGDHPPAVPVDDRPLSGYSICIDNIAESDEDLPVKVPYYIREAADSGRLAKELRFTTFSPGPSPKEGTCRLNIGRQQEENIDTLAKAYGIKVHAFLAKTLEEFSESRIAGQSPCLLDRDGTVLAGQYVLTEKDVLSARKFGDGAVKCAWPVEFWNRKTGPQYSYLDEGEYYEIPHLCLRSKKTINLLAAGRCISALPRALASCRVAGTCMALGEAAAAAAKKALNGETQ